MLYGKLGRRYRGCVARSYLDLALKRKGNGSYLTSPTWQLALPIERQHIMAGGTSGLSTCEVTASLHMRPHTPSLTGQGKKPCSIVTCLWKASVPPIDRSRGRTRGPIVLSNRGHSSARPPNQRAKQTCKSGAKIRSTHQPLSTSAYGSNHIKLRLKQQYTIFDKPS